jgi:hypothetical protein
VSAAEALPTANTELERQADHAVGWWLLVVSAAAIPANPSLINVSVGHGVLAVRESSGCVHCQLARRAIALARCSMRSRRGDGNVLACCAHACASRHCWSGLRSMAPRA